MNPFDNAEENESEEQKSPFQETNQVEGEFEFEVDGDLTDR